MAIGACIPITYPDHSKCPAGTRVDKQFYGDEVAKGESQASSSVSHYDTAQNTPATYYGSTPNTLSTDAATPGFYHHCIHRRCF